MKRLIIEDWGALGCWGHSKGGRDKKHEISIAWDQYGGITLQRHHHHPILALI